jgi:hypothetical protein
MPQKPGDDWRKPAGSFGKRWLLEAHKKNKNRLVILKESFLYLAGNILYYKKGFLGKDILFSNFCVLYFFVFW